MLVISVCLGVICVVCTLVVMLSNTESTDFCSRHQAFAELLASRLASQLAFNALSNRHVCKDAVGQLAEMCD